jgi:thiol-disulfide isomerase/thioredoxin
MLFRIIAGVVVGGGIGLAVGMAGKSVGGQCPILCNPYIATGLGVFLGLFFASQGQSLGGTIEEQDLTALESPESYRAAVAGPGLNLVTFYTDNCTYCHKQLPILGRLAEQMRDRVTVAVANARELRDIAREEEIEGVPTTVVYRDGRRVDSLSGLADMERLRDVVRRYGETAAEPTSESS